jgi:excisionase family DNA binding protein
LTESDARVRVPGVYRYARYLTISEAAKLLGVSERQVWRYVGDGRLGFAPRMRKGRKRLIRSDGIERFVDKYAIPQRGKGPRTRKYA